MLQCPAGRMFQRRAHVETVFHTFFLVKSCLQRCDRLHCERQTAVDLSDGSSSKNSQYFMITTTSCLFVPDLPHKYSCFVVKQQQSTMIADKRQSVAASTYKYGIRMTSPCCAPKRNLRSAAGSNDCSIISTFVDISQQTLYCNHITLVSSEVPCGAAAIPCFRPTNRELQEHDHQRCALRRTRDAVESFLRPATSQVRTD